MAKKPVYKRYSLAFKRQVVAEYEAGASRSALQRKYDIGSLRTLRQWVQRYGTQGLRYGVMHIQTPEEADQVRQLQQRIAQLEKALADAVLEKALLQGTLALYQATYGHELAEKKGPSSPKPTPSPKEP